MSFTNLVRFKDKDGRVLYGDVPEANLNNIIGSNIPLLIGDPFDDSLKPTNERAVVREVCYCSSLRGRKINRPPDSDQRPFKTNSFCHLFQKSQYFCVLV